MYMIRPTLYRPSSLYSVIWQSMRCHGCSLKWALRCQSAHSRILQFAQAFPFNADQKSSSLLDISIYFSNMCRGTSGSSEDGALRRRHTQNRREFPPILHRREQEPSGTASRLQRQQVSPSCMSRIFGTFVGDDYRL